MNDYKKPLRALRIATLFLTLPLLLAAADKGKPQPSAADGSQLTWPLPPEKPRIRFVRQLVDNFDVEPRKKKSWVDRMVGNADPNATDRFEKPAGLKARMTNGKAEIQRSAEAKKNVKSFRMKTVLRMHPGQALETLVEVSCPDRERFTTTIGEKSFHAVRIGNKAYVEQKDGGWSVLDTQPSGWSPCGGDPGEPAPWAIMNEGRDVSVVLAKMADNMEAKRGLFVGTVDGNCQEWVLDVKIPGGAGNQHGGGHGATGLRYTLCMDQDRHLPLIISMGSGGMVTEYSDWNKPIQIDAPKIEVSAVQGTTPRAR